MSDDKVCNCPLDTIRWEYGLRDENGVKVTMRRWVCDKCEGPVGVGQWRVYTTGAGYRISAGRRPWRVRYGVP